MSKRLYFRADKRKFRPGDQIRTAGHFMSMHNQFFRAVEKALASARPAGKIPREKCLMLYEDESRARERCAGIGGRLYIVSIAAGGILHRGDMRLLGEMAGKVKWGENIFNEARKYWAGNLTDDPCIEVLVRTGTIVEFIEDEYDIEAEYHSIMTREREDDECRMEEFLQAYPDDWD